MSLPPLTKSEVKTGGKFVFIDRVKTVFEIASIRNMATSGRTLIFETPPQNLESKTWYRSLEQKNLLRQFSWHVFSFADRFKAEDEAFKYVEKVYALLLHSGRIPVNPLKRIYQSSDIELAFKKELIVQLADYFRTINAVSGLRAGGLDVIFLPSSNWFEIDGMIRQLEGISFGSSSGTVLKNPMLPVAVFIERLKMLLRLKLIVPWILTRIRRLEAKTPTPTEIPLAVRIYKTDWGMRGKGTSEADWIIDGKKFSRENTLFVAETDLYKQYEDEISTRKYLFAAMDFPRAFRTISVSFLSTELISKFFLVLPSLAFQSLRSPSCVIKVSTYAWIDYFRWKNFLAYWRPNSYFAYHDIFLGHIFRNTLLSQSGCQTWYLDHSHTKLSTFDDGNEISGRQSIRAYMKYDREIHWGKKLIQLAQKHFNYSSTFFAYGPVLGEQCRYSAELDKMIKDRWGESPSGMIFSVFPGTNGIDGVNSEEGHRHFLKALEMLLENFPDLKILFKPKNQDYQSNLGKEGTDVAEIFSRLKIHPRFMDLVRFTSANAMIYFSDLVLSMSFASPTLEALIAGKKGLYYDGGNNFPHSYFREFPHLVARDENELLEHAHFWLRMSAAEFDHFRNEYILSEYGMREKPAAELIRDELTREMSLR